MPTLFSAHKTKIVATIGPASRSRQVLRAMIRAGMNVARLNFSHGNLEQHSADIKTIRELAREMEKTVAIMADLPGPKIRIGMLEGGLVDLQRGKKVRLTTKNILGTHELIPVQLPELSEVVRKGKTIYLNDGFIQLKVTAVEGEEVLCRVIIGGRLLDHKGLNLPGAHIRIDPVTARDLELARFGLSEGVDAFCVSFASSGQDILKVKEFARSLGKNPAVLAKIERAEAIAQIDNILQVADGIMVARGDLGVEIPLEELPIVQKSLIFKSNLAGKPVITATQMLESMTENIRPTRAEVTDVANAILDGTDAVMLSEETAIGSYPVDTISVMARIARATERQRRRLETGAHIIEAMRNMVVNSGAMDEDMISLDTHEALLRLAVPFVLTPTVKGGMPRRISRFKSDAWILAFCKDEQVCNFLALSYGVRPICSSASRDEDIIAHIRNEGLVRNGDKVIIARRMPTESVGKVNSLKIIVLNDDR